MGPETLPPPPQKKKKKKNVKFASISKNSKVW